MDSLITTSLIGTELQMNGGNGHINCLKLKRKKDKNCIPELIKKAMCC